MSRDMHHTVAAGAAGAACAAPRASEASDRILRCAGCEIKSSRGLRMTTSSRARLRMSLLLLYLLARIYAWCARSCAHHSAERAALCAALSAAVLPWNPWNPCRGRRAISPPSSGGETNSEASGHAPVGECTETWRSARRGASTTQGSGVLGCGASGCGRLGVRVRARRWGSTAAYYALLTWKMLGQHLPVTKRRSPCSSCAMPLSTCSLVAARRWRGDETEMGGWSEGDRREIGGSLRLLGGTLGPRVVAAPLDSSVQRGRRSAARRRSSG